MRAISLWQPWASAIAVGSKRIETRHWSTNYRGPLAIHAAKRLIKNELTYYSACWNWCGALRHLGLIMGNGKPLWELLPFGAIVATCNLVECRKTELFTSGEIFSKCRPAGEESDLYDWTENEMGDFTPGRFGWILDDIKKLEIPIPFRGAQGFFDVRDDLLNITLSNGKTVARNLELF